MLRLPDKWVWDWWLADTGDEYHLFFLQASRSLEHEHMRHENASIGHAVSTDLRAWRLLPDALHKGPPGAWDDVATWTGSCIQHEGTWYLFYTGTSTVESGSLQRIGLATSPDLVGWTRHPRNPILAPDPRWYEIEDHDAWHDTAWRDPWVFRDPDGHGFHALITARSREGAPDARGVVGHAWSRDLVDWEVGPPLSEPGEFGQMEVLQSVLVEGTPRLIFSAGASVIGADRRARLPHETTAGLMAAGESLLGPWDLAGTRVLTSELYSVRLVQDRAGEWQLLGFIGDPGDGRFRGELSDPVSLRELGVTRAPGVRRS